MNSPTQSRLRFLPLCPFFVYALVDPRDDAIFYIGLSQDCRTRFRQHIRNKKTSPLKSWIDELRAARLAPRMIVLETFHALTEHAALSIESKWIARYAGGRLLNRVIYHPATYSTDYIKPEPFHGSLTLAELAEAYGIR